MRGIPKLTFYTFTCDACKNTLSVSEPFELHFCPFCGHVLDDLDEDNTTCVPDLTEQDI